MRNGMGKEKEKQVEKGRDRRKEKRSGKEQRKEIAREVQDDVPVAAGEQFFKVFFPEQSGEGLKIPSPFHEYVEEAPNRVVSLRGPSGHSWRVVLTTGSQGLVFTQGWKEFARDHSLIPGHFLLFTYDGCSEFSVAVFTPLGVEDKAVLKVQPCKELLVKQEEEEGTLDVAADGTLEASDTPFVEGNGATTGKRVRDMDYEMTSGTAQKRHSSVQEKPKKKKPEATAGTSNAALTVIHSTKDYPLLLDEYSCYSKTRIKSKDVPRMGEFVSKKFRQPVVASQRRLVTEEEKDYALQRANEFKSKNPFAAQLMMGSYVHVGFFMDLPCEFVKRSLPRTNKKMTLWDPQGKSWEVNYIFYGRYVAAFSGGWGKFALGNNLERFDVCIFELFKEDNFKVHIYRVVPEITPLIRKSGM